MTLRINPLELHRSAIDVPDGSQSVLILSMRNVSTLVGYCPLYEFEDLTAEMLDAAVAQVRCMSGLELSKSVHKYVRYLTGSTRLATGVRPSFGAVELERTYDVFLPFFNHPHEIFALNGLSNWRKRSRFAACYLAEAWEALMPRYQLEMLRDFDHIFVGVQGSVSAVAAITGRPCTFVPMGVDTLRFCPWPAEPERVIRVCNIGRRSEVTHKALLEYAEHTSSFYYYNTTRLVGTGDVSFAVTDQREHRLLLANLLKRSSYFIANRAFADRPALTAGKEEVPARYYEGAAAGALMIGDPPQTTDFQEQFGWNGSVIPAPFHASQIGDLITDLESDRAHTAALRRQNAMQALLRHDWVYRLQTMLDTVGLKPNERMLQREKQLREQADTIQSRSVHQNAAAGSGRR